MQNELREMKRRGIALGITVLLLGFGVFSFMNDRKVMRITAKDAFQEAIMREKKLYIDSFFFNYDESRSSDNISGAEKLEWAHQAVLTMDDSCRYRLDSLFRLELEAKQVPVLWSAVCCLRGKDTLSVSPKSRLQEKFLLDECVYRKNTVEANHITLRAYMQLSIAALLNQWYAYLFLVWLIGLAVFYKYEKWKQKNTGESDNYLRLREDLFFDELNGVLKSGEQILQLKNLEKKYFCAFLQAEEHVLSFEYLLTYIHDYKNIEVLQYEDKKRVYQEMNVLRKMLKDFGIEISSVPGTGYRMELGESNRFKRQSRD